MINAILASTALMATAALAGGSVGTAHVINDCGYDVLLSNTPASGGGYSAIDKTLKPNDKYSQTWTELSNSQGWSIKLSKTDSFENPLQYEYTFHDDGIIWFDLSAVNGNPWDGNYEISAAGDNCSPKQAAYRYATDDAFGMQDCPSASDITLRICSGEGDSGSGSSGAASSGPAPSSPAESSWSEPTSTAAPAPASSAPAAVSSAPAAVSSDDSDKGHNTWQFGHNTWNFQGKEVANAPTQQATTFAKVVSSAPSENHPPGVTVTHVATQVVTQLVTATAEAPAKRHEHHRRHQHERS